MKPRGYHPEKKLNPLMIKNTTTPGKYADGNDLYLIVTAAGKKWIWRATVNDECVEIGLGSVKAVNLAKVRKAAETLSEWNRERKDVLAEWRA